MRRFAAAMLLAALAAVQAAAAAEKAPEVTPTRNSAVGYALTLDQVTRSFAGRCGSHDAAQARVARAAWAERNGELVSSADRYLGFVKNLLTKTQGEEAARRFYEEQKAAFARRAQLTVWDSLLAGGGEAQVCEHMLGAIAAGRMDVDAKHLRTLQEISAELSRAGAR